MEAMPSCSQASSKPIEKGVARSLPIFLPAATSEILANLCAQVAFRNEDIDPIISIASIEPQRVFLPKIDLLARMMPVRSLTPKFVNCPFHIALCCNGTMLPGLHATLASLVKHLGRRELVSLTLFIQDIRESEVACLKGTISDAGGVGALKFHEADISEFKGLKTLHGDWMIYMRLFLPRLLPDAETILYLDSDLVVNTDACAFFDHKLDDIALGAINGPPVEWSLDHKFLRMVGLTDQDRSFNSGVLLFNATLWRKTDLVNRAMEMARNYAPYLTSHDQSVLNGLFSRDFYELPKQFNTVVVPQDKPLADVDCIYHFVGSPKPWDPLGRYFHGNWKIWNSVVKQTQFKWSDFLSHHFAAYGKRAWTLRRSYLRTLGRKQT